MYRKRAGNGAGNGSQSRSQKEMREGKRYGAAFFLLTVLLLVFILLNLGLGSVSIAPGQVLRILAGRAGDSTASSIIRDIRLPRTLAACLLGGGLSVSGFLLQTFFHNPIAGPFVLGISSGAKLLVALTMVYSLAKGMAFGSAGMLLAAFLGSMICTGFVLAVSARVERMSVLIIAGVMIGYICSAVTDFVVTFADDSNIVNLHNWSMGSFSGTSFENVRIMAVLVLGSVFLTFLLSKPIGAFQLGEHYALSLGVNVKLFRVCLIFLSSILSATVTAFAGPISFVGVAVPHLVRSLLGTSKPIIVIPACFLGGSVFCLFCDLIARTLFSPVELSISSVTAIFGAPVVLWIMIRRQQGQQV